MCFGESNLGVSGRLELVAAGLPETTDFGELRFVQGTDVRHW